MNTFTLQLDGTDVELVMNALNEMPAKVSRNLMNNIERQAISQIQQFKAAQVKQEAESNERVESELPPKDAK